MGAVHMLGVGAVDNAKAAGVLIRAMLRGGDDDQEVELAKENSSNYHDK